MKLCRLTVAAIALAFSLPAWAQVPYDANCRPVKLTELQQADEEMLETHAGYRFFVAAPINGGCKAINYVRNLFTSQGSIDNRDLIDGVTDDLPRPSGFQRFVNSVKSSVDAALGSTPKGDVILTPDKKVAYYEGTPVGSGRGTGAIIYADGKMARGSFDSKYDLNGPGQLVTPDGKTRTGEFKDGRLAGEGFVSEQDGNRTVLVEGTFDGDTPVGEVIRNYADGSRVRELWENGKMVARGERAPKGKVPPAINRPAPPNNDGEGYFLVEGANGMKQWEFRCRGRETLTFGWYPKGQTPQKPSGLTCEVKQPAAIVQITPVARSNGNPLLVDGPPWICEAQIAAFSAAWTRRTGGVGGFDAAGYWRQMDFNAAKAIAYSDHNVFRWAHELYISAVPGAASRPVVFTDEYGNEFREGFFRSRQAMSSLASNYTANDGSGSETASAIAISSCVARHLADIATE